ncbi:MarR family winged helix-turn-helix transcriptional regulator [Streptomyces sp. TRM 70361]|uniref:MarR family winged helix-turn-helix transcriptional regulator n=1 Tax=Streptomyces sp. TRM 70361 TaxID=3116553 RepID=UPI002E7C02B9|nr:MarR family winged helix-turn-helix transcriptional regulator [Streptomyces sp. TRM 70361]MEE1939971.1 MarR family winged helix-turn-helix transcriptional regulator [Streptomyces sp. TRM 70361]
MTMKPEDPSSPPVRRLPREASLGYQVNHLARLLERALRLRIEEYGVVPGQFAPLLALYEQEGFTQRELCERVQIEQPTMANTLQRMERDGLIHRVPDPHDKRQAKVLLSDRARELREPLIAAARDVNSLATRGLDAAEVAQLLSLIAQSIENLASAGRS